jgi:hypothetical protein
MGLASALLAGEDEDVIHLRTGLHDTGDRSDHPCRSYGSEIPLVVGCVKVISEPTEYPNVAVPLQREKPIPQRMPLTFFCDESDCVGY